MPPDATIDEAIERLVFLAKFEAGLSELDAGNGIPHNKASAALACDPYHPGLRSPCETRNL